jgi:hypothetical protein
MATSATKKKKIADNDDNIIVMAANIIKNAAENSATGVLFSGKPFRSFDGRRRFMAGWEEEQQEQENHSIEQHCDQWAVVTTIAAPTESIKMVAELPGWCTEVVADTKTPVDFVEQLANLTNGGGGSNSDSSKKKKPIHFLSVKDEEKWAERSVGAGTRGIFVILHKFTCMWICIRTFLSLIDPFIYGVLSQFFEF